MSVGLSRWQDVELLVTVRAYPAISQKYGEVACVAGLRTDTLRWVRLFPIPYRELPFSQQFSKYQLVRLKAERHTGDNRPESMRPNTTSLRLGKKIGTERGWRRRRALVDPILVDGMCEVERRQAQNGTSLAAFRPADVDDFLIDRVAGEWEPDKQSVIDQPTLFAPTKTGLAKIPWRFRYAYRCQEARCPGHRHSNIDWELAEAARKWPKRYGEVGALEQIRKKWLDEICGPDKDTVFFVGNMHRFPKTFMILGTFWPPKA